MQVEDRWEIKLKNTCNFALFSGGRQRLSSWYKIIPRCTDFLFKPKNKNH